MEIVYFGDAESVYNKNLIAEMEKYGFSVSICDIANEFKKITTKNFSRYIKKLLLIFQIFSCYKKSEKKNRIAHIQFVPFYSLFCLPFFLSRFSKFVLTFWGSDLLRQNKIKLFLLFPVFWFANKITFETDEMKNIFLKQFPLFRKSKKLYIVRFGLNELDEIDNITKTEIDAFQKKYGIKKNAKKVVIGYNRKKEMQHLAVVKSFSFSKQKNHMQLIFPWTYGDNDDVYKNELILECRKNKYSFIFLENFLPDTEIAALRLSTDILIQVQTTDSFSASMLETLYAKKNVITGSWFPYDFLKDIGIKMTFVTRANDVGFIIDEVLDSLPNRKIENENNARIVAEISKWNVCIQNWIDLYN